MLALHKLSLKKIYEACVYKKYSKVRDEIINVEFKYE